MLLKGVEELVKDIILSLLARAHVRVQLSVVLCFDVRNIEDAITIDVHLCEGHPHKGFSFLVDWASDHAQKLFIVDGSTAVSVNQIENSFLFVFVTRDAVVSQTLAELFARKRFRAIVINNAERAANSDNTARSSALDAVTDVFEQLCVYGSLVFRLRWVLSRIGGGHFFTSCLLKLSVHVGTFRALNVPLALACNRHARIGGSNAHILRIGSLLQLIIAELVGSVSVSSAKD